MRMRTETLDLLIDVHRKLRYTGLRCIGLGKMSPCLTGDGAAVRAFRPGSLPLDDGRVLNGKGLIILYLPPELGKSAPVSTTTRIVTVWNSSLY